MNVPIPYYDPNEDQYKQRNAIIIICVIFSLMTIVAISLRFYVRGFIIKQFGLDDWVCLWSAVSSPRQLLSALELTVPFTGLGSHGHLSPC